MRTITSKLARVYLLVTVSVIVLAGVISLFYLYHHTRATAHENLYTQSVAMVGNLEGAVAFDDGAFAQQILDALKHYPELQLAAVVKADGKLLATYGKNKATIAAVMLQPYLLQSDFMTVNTHGVMQTISVQDDVPTRLVLVASLEKLNREIQIIALASLAIGVLMLLAAFNVFRRLSHKLTRPLEDLTDVMRLVERDNDYSQRSAVVSDDEIGELAHGFNAMLSALERQNTNLNTELDERKSMQEKLDRLAHFDNVTNLPNRHYFHERLNVAVTHSIQLDKPMAVLFVDLDNFKLVNDSYGHHIGDKLLHTVAERLMKSLRSGDVVCRLGGDEFAIILEHLPDAAQLKPLTEKLILHLTQPLRLDSHDIVVSGSIGIAVCPEDADTPESLLRFADTAMYAAKGAGKNTWRRFDPEMASQSTLRLTLENQLRVALAEDQLEVHYQPQVDLTSGTVAGVEALARWNHPERGYISPAQFIPVAEESGLIRPLGEWVLRTACRQIVAWNQEGHKELKVAVNVSARQLVHAGFADLVLGILSETGCPSSLLEIEITESVLMQHSDKTVSLLETLHGLGIGIAIDDFGTGYSSMARLKSLPVTKLKIDKSFIDEITTNRADLAITAAMTSLANNLQIQVITEGVESSAQVMLLRQSGCHSFQGYHFARPMPATQVAAFISNFGRPTVAQKVGADATALAI